MGGSSAPSCPRRWEIPGKTIRENHKGQRSLGGGGGGGEEERKTDKAQDKKVSNIQFLILILTVTIMVASLWEMGHDRGVKCVHAQTRVRYAYIYHVVSGMFIASGYDASRENSLQPGPSG